MAVELEQTNAIVRPPVEIPIISVISGVLSAGVGYTLNPLGVLLDKECSHRYLKAIAGFCLVYGPTLAVVALKVFADVEVPLINEFTGPNILGATTGIAFGALRRRGNR